MYNLHEEKHLTYRKSHKRKSARNKFRGKISFKGEKSMYKFHEEKNEHATSFICEISMPLSFTNKSARKKFH